MTRSVHGPLAHLHDALRDLERSGLRRRPPLPHSDNALSFCSNDYLGLAGRTAPTGASTGAGGSRLITGERAAHVELERAFAEWLGVETCLAFASGYAANVGALAALAAPGDLIVSDALNHASLIDGARLARARVAIVRHNDLEAIADALATRAERRAWVVVESYYSMDADGPALGELRGICDAQNAALYVDEAHALGVLGPGGRGRCAEAGVTPDVLVGTLGKAFGSQGAFVGGASILRDWLWNRARSFVFSTGLAPVSAVAARLALEEVVRTPELRRHVAEMADYLRGRIEDLGLSPMGFGHVVPILLGDSARAVTMSQRLAERSIFVPPIRPPTVPEGTARLRLTVTAHHREDDIDALIVGLRHAMEAR